MKFVTWTNFARDQLADIYVSTPSDRRDLLIQKMHELEQTLLEQGIFAGESRSGNERIYFHDQLMVYFLAKLGGELQITYFRSLRNF